MPCQECTAQMISRLYNQSFGIRTTQKCREDQSRVLKELTISYIRHNIKGLSYIYVSCKTKQNINCGHLVRMTKASVRPSMCITQKRVTIDTYKNDSCDALGSVLGLCDYMYSDASQVHFCDVKIYFILCDCLFLWHFQIFVAWLFWHATQMDRLHLRHVPCCGQFGKL